MSFAQRGSLLALETASGIPLSATPPAIPCPSGTRNCLTSSALPPNRRLEDEVVPGPRRRGTARRRCAEITLAAVSTIISSTRSCVAGAATSAPMTAVRRRSSSASSSATPRAPPWVRVSHSLRNLRSQPRKHAGQARHRLVERRLAGLDVAQADAEVLQLAGRNLTQLGADRDGRRSAPLAGSPCLHDLERPENHADCARRLRRRLLDRLAVDVGDRSPG